MNQIQLEEKLSILLTSRVITKNAFNTTLNTFVFLSKKLKKEVIKDSEMFWTHMAMALTRIERGESEESPAIAIINEVYETPYKNAIEEVIDCIHYKNAIEEVIDCIHSLAGLELPEGERVYFYLHLHKVIESNE
ncbi:PRD domain-containing protein [Bacillus paralicheniformis]|uniref:PRD domain-containing protein n=1 Tax=Bacillus paralicheniformis TaxID=1648923 RepID=UPI003F7A13BB